MKPPGLDPQVALLLKKRQEKEYRAALVVGALIFGAVCLLTVSLLIQSSVEEFTPPCYFLEDCADSQVQRLFVLPCGYIIVPKNVSTRGEGASFLLSEPITAYLIQTELGYVLVDTGSNVNRVISPNTTCLQEPLVDFQHNIFNVLKTLNVKETEIQYIILTHMHMDHAGNVIGFPNAQIIVNEDEYYHAFRPDLGPSWVPSDYNSSGLQWKLISGDYQLAKGLTIVSTKGHTPGHQSVVVELPHTATVILTGDVGDLQENFDHEILPGEATNDQLALASIQLLNQIKANSNGQLFIGHDPNLIQLLKRPPEFYD